MGGHYSKKRNKKKKTNANANANASRTERETPSFSDNEVLPSGGGLVITFVVLYVGLVH